MLVRAGAANAAMVSALGVNIRRLFMIVFGFGTMLAGFAGIMIAPILSVEPGMGDTILILAFVVIVIGGIGSIRGAFLAALLIGLVDTLGRSFAVDILRLIMAPSPARTVGPAIASMLIYLLMAVVLYLRPSGLFPAQGARVMADLAMPASAQAHVPRPYARIRDCQPQCCCCFAIVPLFAAVQRRGISSRAFHARDDLRHRGARARPASSATARWCRSAMPLSSGSAPMRSAFWRRTAINELLISLAASRSPPRRCSPGAPASSACAPRASISS